MITDKNTAWMKEFLLGLCEKAEDKGTVEEIVDSFKKLWRVVRATEQNPYPRSPRLTEAIEAIKPPPKPPSGFNDRGS